MSGEMCFSWVLPVGDAFTVAEMMLDTINEYIQDQSTGVITNYDV